MIVSALWIVLFALRVCLVLEEDGPGFAQVYIFLFAMQVFLLMIRFLQIFSNSSFLGTIWRIIKLSLFSLLSTWCPHLITRLVFRLIIAEISDFGRRVVWFVAAVLYVFEVFVGTDLSGLGDEPLAIAFTGVAILFGALMLTNLLIALMATQVVLHLK